MKLEDESERVRAKRGQRSLIQSRRVGAGQDDTARSWTVEQSHDVEQRALARAGRAHERGELPLLQYEIDACKRSSADALAVFTNDLGDRQNGFSHRELPSQDRAGRPVAQE